MTLDSSIVRWMVRVPTLGHALWLACWGWDPYVSGGKTENEIDVCETLADNTFTFNLHNPEFKGAAPSRPMDTNWHEIGFVKTPTYVSFLFDGVESPRRAVSMPGRLALLMDCKVGWGWDPNGGPNASTPSTVGLQIASVTVDPVA